MAFPFREEPIAKLVEADLSNPRRCYLFGTTPLGGSDACRPEMQEDGSILMRSLNLSHVVYRITDDQYRDLREYPKLKVGMWSFADENDPDADRIAGAHRYPESAGRRVGDLERRNAALIEALDACEEYFDNRADADCDQDGYIPNEEMKLLTLVRDALEKAGAK